MIVAILEQSEDERCAQQFLVDTSLVQDTKLRKNLETKGDVQPDYDLWQDETERAQVDPPQMVEKLVDVWLG